ncbi:serine hydrolase domain-containing protein [Pedobacter punctiformis]|uniref:Serine hydrolase n=1 Tax=Pedobacter punctiformis TaxID=3004097 RepID=A0ABT4LA60_9SPHI|nr:serine hydrolase domain-containing protein [Pedobacter sp. HCMS5-2]MCZ4244798.1 serine hydrolase [Pedobacter sp. HCMS5-2]
MRRLFTTILIITASFKIKAQETSIVADSLMLKNQIPELGFVVVSADSVLELKTLGFHRIDIKNEQTKANINDYFHLGSNTKAITGFIAAYLVENNKIQWTTKFFDLFPSWKKQSNPKYLNITLADLLSHRAKIQPYTSGLEFQELPEFEGDKSEQRKQFSKYLLIEKPVKNNEKLYNYSNAGYSIAALMLEKVSGKTWEELIKEIMKKKLNVDVRFSWPNKINLNQPYGHWIENDTLKPLLSDTDYNLSLGEPAGDICMTLPDYAKFIQLNLQGLLGSDNILKAGTYNFLHFGLKDYSIGWGNINNKEKQLSEHSGSAGTFFCYTLLDKNKKLAYIIVANSATQETQESIFKLLNILRKKYGK